MKLILSPLNRHQTGYDATFEDAEGKKHFMGWVWMSRNGPTVINLSNFIKPKPMEEIFLMQKIWISPMENEVNAAVGYEPVGWVHSEQEAQDIINKCKTYTRADCWAIREPMSEFRFKKLVKHELE